MNMGDGLVPGAAATGEAKAYLRIAGGDEDALLTRLVTAAAEACELDTGLVLLTRNFSDVVKVGGGWRRLTRIPVRAILGVEALAADGSVAALPVESYEIDIDARGEGRVRVERAGGALRTRVSYRAGLAAEWEAAPHALRQGVVRLAAHFYAHRDSARDSAPPAAVAALWRPWRRLRIG